MALACAMTGFNFQMKADTEILKPEDGYAKITSMPSNLSDYYFVFVDKDQDLMMTLGSGANQGSEYKTWWYRASTNPAEDFNKVWMIEENNNQNNHPIGYAFRNLQAPELLMQTVWNAPWHFRMHEFNNVCYWTHFLFAYNEAEGYWTFENGPHPGNYIGAWAPPVADGGETAGNKNDAEKGKFVIYSITKTDFDKLSIFGVKDENLVRIDTEYRPIFDQSTAEEGVKATYEAAISAAQAAINGATSLEAIKEAMNTLEQARKTYMEVAIPTGGIPFDRTFQVTNAACTSLDGWNITDTPHTFRFNTWSNEDDGSGVMPNLPEYWKQAGDPLADAVITNTVTDLQPGRYKVSGRIRICREQYKGYEPLSGACIYANSEETDATTGTQKDFWGSKVGYGTYSVECIVGDDGILNMGLKVQAANFNWLAFKDFKLEILGEATDKALSRNLQEYLEEVQAKDITTNVGTAAFQKPQALATTVTEAIKTANNVLTSGTASPEVLFTTQKAVQAAVDAFDNATLNSPTKGQVFNIVMSYAGYRHDRKALTYMAGARGDMGNYNLDFRFTPDCDYGQQFIFTPVDSEANFYKVSAIDEDGNERFICTGSPHGGNSAQVCTTTDAAQALTVRIYTTGTEGIYNLYNTEAYDWLGCQDDEDDKCGFYTTSAHNTLRIVKAETPEVTLSTPYEWATLMLPFATEKPEGLTVYTCTRTEANGEYETLILEEATTIKAHTPYIVKAAADFTHTFNGMGTATKDDYTDGLLTGTFKDQTATEGTYVLQNQQELGVNFYKVTDAVIPTLKAYRAFLNAPATASEINVRALILPRNGTTNVGSTTVDGEAWVNVYTLSGIEVRKNVKMSEALKGLSRGIYVVDGIKKAVK